MQPAGAGQGEGVPDVNAAFVNFVYAGTLAFMGHNPHLKHSSSIFAPRNESTKPARTRRDVPATFRARALRFARCVHYHLQRILPLPSVVLTSRPGCPALREICRSGSQSRPAPWGPVPSPFWRFSAHSRPPLAPWCLRVSAANLSHSGGCPRRTVQQRTASNPFAIAIMLHRRAEPAPAGRAGAPLRGLMGRSQQRCVR